MSATAMVMMYAICRPTLLFGAVLLNNNCACRPDLEPLINSQPACMLDSKRAAEGLCGGFDADKIRNSPRGAHYCMLWATELMHSHALCLPDRQLPIGPQPACPGVLRGIGCGAIRRFPVIKSSSAHGSNLSRCAGTRPSPGRNFAPPSNAARHGRASPPRRSAQRLSSQIALHAGAARLQGTAAPQAVLTSEIPSSSSIFFRITNF